MRSQPTSEIGTKFQFPRFLGIVVSIAALSACGRVAPSIDKGSFNPAAGSAGTGSSSASTNIGDEATFTVEKSENWNLSAVKMATLDEDQIEVFASGGSVTLPGSGKPVQIVFFLENLSDAQAADLRNYYRFNLERVRIKGQTSWILEPSSQGRARNEATYELMEDQIVGIGVAYSDEEKI